MPTCTLCRKQYEPIVIMNTTALSLAEYYGVMEFKGKHRWCPDCAVKEYRRTRTGNKEADPKGKGGGD